ncbi:Thiol-disulfide isomerase or thioredoxin [Psychroflexus halocasei]|uniref:Thiol-disulfide isomerase or thioredoxin n=2 Tax=Psychroflexus halocasei TaxID=908615 RepID=A0A1H4CIN7_9FLAO|nr:Thiol-disulfide isomerase or thioredoxin [Psychroflexus halocasei]
MINMRTKSTLFLAGAMSLFFACDKAPEPTPDYAIIKGEVANPKEGVNFRLYNPKTSKTQMIEVDENGKFHDTLKLENPVYFNASYKDVFGLYVQNGFDMTLNFDSESASKSLKIKGEGAEENASLRKRSKETNALFGEDYRDFLSLEEEKYNKAMTDFSDKLNKRLEENKDQLDEKFITSEKKKIDELVTSLAAQREDQLKMNEKVGVGKESPLFEDYMNYDGGTSSLKDFRGSYVYIDMWATWCVPCLYEIPFMKKIEEQYKNDNIKFLAVSLDKKEDEQKWRDLIEKRNLHGTQLLADNAMESQFVKDYFIYGIPRFILLDPEGRIVSADAPRPSEDKLKELFDSLDM